MLVAGLAALNFCWQLGSPSLYIDEAYSWSAAALPLGELFHKVRVDEVAPWAYYVGLHEWIGRLGAQDEWVMRLPSAVAGVALVAVTYRIGRLMLPGRTPALLAAGLTATCPLVLTYAQQVRAYVFAMLLAAVAVWAALEAKRAIGHRQRAWVGVLAVASVGAFWTHYTAPLVLFPLYVWVWRAGELSRRARLSATAGAVVGSLPVVPLMVDQLGRGHEEGVAVIARLTAGNLAQVLGTPFDGRSERVTVWVILGAVAVVAATIAVARGGRRVPAELCRLVLPLAIAPVIVVVALTVVSDDVLVSRYTAVAAPFMLLLLAGGVVAAPRRLRAGLASVALVAAVGGSLDLHRPAGFHADVRGAFQAIAGPYQAGDTVVMFGHPAIGPVGQYYRDRELTGAPLVLIPGQEPALERAVRERRRLWLVNSELQSRPGLRQTLAPFDYRPGSIRRFEGVFDLQLVLAIPR